MSWANTSNQAKLSWYNLEIILNVFSWETHAPVSELTWPCGPSSICVPSQITKFMGPSWGPPGSCRPQMGPMLAPWTLLSGTYQSITPSNSCSLAADTRHDIWGCRVPWCVWILCCECILSYFSTFLSNMQCSPAFAEIRSLATAF